MDWRVWYLTDGSVRATRFLVPDLRERDCAAFLEAHPGATWEDMTEAEYFARLPRKADGTVDRSARHKWRKNPGGRGFIVDPAVPDPPHRHQALLDEVDRATSVEELRDVLRRYITR